MGMGIQGQALAALPTSAPDPYCRKGWVSSRASLDGYVQEKISQHHWSLYLGQSSVSQVPTPNTPSWQPPQ
jgi:hypothetical protein